MADGDFVTYFRVSKKQGQELDQQKAAVERFLNGGNWKVIGSFEEKETGKKAGLDNRPQLRAAIKMAKDNQATLLIAKIDRLARNVHFVSGLMESKAKFVACDMPEANDFTVHIMAAMAEQEAKAISTRTKDRLAYLKSQGVQLGNPNNGSAGQTMKAAAGRSKKADEYVQSIKDDIEFWQKKGYGSLKGLAEVLTRAKVPTSRGHTQWNATQVKRVLERLQDALMPPSSTFTAGSR